MNILVRGEKIRTEELKQKLSSVECNLKVIDDTDLSSANLYDFDIIFDLAFDDHPDQLKYYAGIPGKIVFVSSVKQQLARVMHEYGKEINCELIGLNALPTFINRSLMELSVFSPKTLSLVEEYMKKLKWDYKIVEDRVGMVTPRIVFMIINEACYTFQEGTASIRDIDTSMKLGTNYPFGPFEWADKIGIEHVYKTLEAIYHDTHDERYKICPLLKTMYLKGSLFYA